MTNFKDNISIIILIFCCCTISVLGTGNNEPERSSIVVVQQGKLQGMKNKSEYNGYQYYTFAGVPYAKRPLNEFRFMPPVPLEKWEDGEDIYEAIQEKDACIQNNAFVSRQYIGSEDCLYLNIDIPRDPSEIKEPLAVMVFFHGGGFYTGSGSDEMYSADYLIQRNVILVRVTYRLHVFGFLNLGLEDCRGNAGLKDQTMAIRWVRDNIEKLGGNPSNITIFGESAGAAAVHFHLLSPLSRGLFQKAIIQSGTALTPWALTYNYKDMAAELGKRLGFEGGDSQKLLEFLKKQSAADLNKHVFELTDYLRDEYPARCTIIPFSPSVEEIKDDGAFLPDFPEKLLNDVLPIPIMYGVNNKEGLLAYAVLTENLAEKVGKDFSTVLEYNFRIDKQRLPELSEKIKEYYFGDKKVGPETANELVNLYSDLYFYYLYEPIELPSKSPNPPFVYQFSYDGSLNSFKTIVIPDPPKNVPGASHGDELGYIFYPRVKRGGLSYNDDDRTVIENMTKLWTNFARIGKPSDDGMWKPSTLSEPRYLNIDKSLELKNGKVFGERLQFLRDLLDPVIGPIHQAYNVPDIFKKSDQKRSEPESSEVESSLGKKPRSST